MTRRGPKLEHYEIHSDGFNNWCLDAPGNIPNDGTRLQVYPCNGGGNQLWRFDAQFAQSYQALTPADAEEVTCIDAAGGGTGDHVPLQVYTCKGSENQRWQLRRGPTNGGVVMSQHGAPWECLNVPFADTSDDVLLQQCQCDPTAANEILHARWRDGAYVLRIHSSDKCVSAWRAGAGSNNTQLVQQTCGDTNYSQTWFLY